MTPIPPQGAGLEPYSHPPARDQFFRICPFLPDFKIEIIYDIYNLNLKSDDISGFNETVCAAYFYYFYSFSYCVCDFPGVFFFKSPLEGQLLFINVRSKFSPGLLQH